MQSDGLMDNWKKLIVMDPVLSDLLDSSLDPEQFIRDVIADRPPEQVSALYAKLGTFKHTLLRHLQKEVQRNSERILQNFNSSNQHIVSMENPAVKRARLAEARDSLVLYNKKYANIQQKTVELRNCYRMLTFSKHLQKFIVLSKMLRSLNRGTQVMHRVKTSEILKQQEELCINNDFSGIRVYENERPYIKSIKDALIKKNEQKFAESMERGEQQELLESVRVAHNLGNNLAFTIKEVFNRGLTEMTGEAKKQFLSESPLENELAFLTNMVVKKCIEIIDLESLLLANNYATYLKSYNLSELFGKLWSKVVEIVEKTYKRILEEPKDSKFPARVARANELRRKYPLVFSEFVAAMNDVHAHLLQTNNLNYDFNPLRERFALAFQQLSREYTQQLTETNRQLFGELLKAVRAPTQQNLFPSLAGYITFVQTNFNIIHTAELFRQFMDVVLGNLMELGGFVEELQSETDKLFAEVVQRLLIQQQKEAVAACSSSHQLRPHDLQFFQIKDLAVGKDSKVHTMLRLLPEQVQNKIFTLVKLQ